MGEGIDLRDPLVAKAFNLWMRRFIEHPEQFGREWQEVSKYLREEREGREPSYGEVCVEYLRKLVRDLAGKMRVWCIGSDGTEFWAARSEEEMRECYIAEVGESQAKEDIEDGFDELSDERMDEEFDFNDNGKTVRTTFRKLAEKAEPGSMLSTGYN
jgi:hypothetical protein